MQAAYPPAAPRRSPAQPPPHVLRPVAALPLLLVLSLATGCQGLIHGEWHMVDARPNPETFALEDVEFRRDGTFAATITLEGRTARETGEYDFNGFKLRLRPAAGGERSFNAALHGRTLDVMRGEKKVVLRKGANPR